MMPATSPKSKAVTVIVVDMYAGIYQTSSSDGVSAYRTDVKARTCSCAAGNSGFRNCGKGMCRHLVAARVVARGIASMPTKADRERAARIVVRVNVAAVNVAALSLPLVAEVLPSNVLVMRAEKVAA